MEKEKNGPTKTWRLLGADLFSRITFSVTSGLLIEIFIAGMTVQQSLLSRAVNTPIVMLTARPYGMFRDWVLKKLKIRKEQRRRYIFANQVAYAAFFCPQYALVLWIEGASSEQILKAAGFIALTSPVLGAIFGYWMDFVRARIFKIRSQHEEPQNTKESS